ncbi:glycosyltransferase family 9 protein [Brevundimonas sp. LF-1]|uniref:glycosyltransferase family 9 protein n=1 Tax=Brevundimonas sp. LF-1 TaxID=3126100 RepID=UPI0030E3B34C
MGKRWPADRYAKVAISLLGEGGPLAGGRLMIVGEEADRDAAQTIRSAVKRDRVIELQGRLTRLQTAAALSHADLYLGGDSCGRNWRWRRASRLWRSSALRTRR